MKKTAIYILLIFICFSNLTTTSFAVESEENNQHLSEARVSKNVGGVIKVDNKEMIFEEQKEIYDEKENDLLFNDSLQIDFNFINEQNYSIKESEIMPAIINVSVNNLPGKYIITAKISDDYALEEVKFPTWTSKNGMDDITWEKGIINGDTVTYTVDMERHNNETGEYVTQIYAYDKAGKLAFYALPTQNIENAAPKIDDVSVESQPGKYIITAKISDDYALEEVKFPTWTSKNGMDDITWEKGIINGDTVTYTVDMERHNNETGEYVTQIYAYDKAGKLAFYALPTQNIENAAPKINDVSVENLPGKYIITAKITDDYALREVKFPTWTSKDGMDDITWEKGIVNGDTFTYTVDIRDHNYETSGFITQIYAYDKAGVLATFEVLVQTIKNAAPTISNIAVTSALSGSYIIECDVMDDIEIDHVEYAVWSTANGQDDLVWKSAKIDNGKARLIIDAIDHNFEAGEYITHIYTYDKAGLYTVTQYSQNMLAPATLPGWQIINGKKYLFNNQGQYVKGANKLVIDVSYANGNIDWQAVKNSGVDAVILQVGFGWNDNLEAQRDKKFNRNADELERLGIPYGVYLFSYENSAAGAEREAQYTIDLIKGRYLSFPVFYDLEYDDYMGDISPNTYTAMAHAYCKKIEAAGYTAGIYANLNYWNTKLFEPSLDRYVKWIAQYNMNDGQAGHCDYTKPYKMWQYTSVGKISGINTNVDMNAFFN